MKANLKSGNAAVRLLLAHGEKIGMGGIVLCTAMLLWSAFGRERLGDDKQPQKLEELVSQAKNHIEHLRWDDVDVEDKLIAEPVNGEAMKAIPRVGFPPFRSGFERGTLDQVGLRTDPILLTAEDLEVHGDFGLWAFADPADIEKKQIQAMAEKDSLARERDAELRKGREESENGGARRARGTGLRGPRPGAAGRDAKVTKGGAIVQIPRTGAQLEGFEQLKASSWVTLLAKIPVQQQYQHYEEVLQNARGYQANSDIPNYVGYRVQRAEITDAGEGEWDTLATVTAKTIEKELDTYPLNMQDVVATRFKHSVMTHPLPPLILREWDERVSHSSMPLLSEKRNAMSGEEAIEESTEEGEEDDLFGGPGVSERREMETGRRPRRAGLPMGSRGGGLNRRGGGGGKGGEGGGDFVSGVSSRPFGTALTTFTWDLTTSHVLLRYFDNEAKPGRKYRYKVQLVLADVNYSSSVQYLDKSVTERRADLKGMYLKYRFTDWSEASPTVSVPLPARVYLASAKPTKETNLNAEPEAELLIKALNSEYAAEVAYSDFFSRGSVINLRKNAKVVISSKFDPEEEPEFDFLTGITLLDFSGGEKLSKRNRDLIAPARAVLMDASGRLFLQTEMDDYQPVAEYQQIIEGGQGSRRPPRGSARSGGRGFGDGKR